MSERRFSLAQANVAHMRAPLEDPPMDGFRSQLERINALADRSPGFVWRLQSDAGDATAIRAFDDPLILFNMSVWESLEGLHAYVYRSDHVQPLRARREWFRPMPGPSLVLWWIPARHTPTVEEARAKLDALRRGGPGPQAFTFRQPFPTPGAPPSRAPEVDAEFCAGSSA
ncbi:MAG: DUF3291 domain-containing protein [Myxococcota bacterium]